MVDFLIFFTQKWWISFEQRTASLLPGSLPRPWFPRLPEPGFQQDKPPFMEPSISTPLAVEPAAKAPHNVWTPPVMHRRLQRPDSQAMTGHVFPSGHDYLVAHPTARKWVITPVLSGLTD